MGSYNITVNAMLKMSHKSYAVGIFNVLDGINFAKQLRSEDSLISISRRQDSTVLVEYIPDDDEHLSLIPLELNYKGLLSEREINGLINIIKVMCNKYMGENVDYVMFMERVVEGNNLYSFYPYVGDNALYYKHITPLARWCNLRELKGYDYLTSDPILRYAFTISTKETQAKLTGKLKDVDGVVLVDISCSLTGEVRELLEVIESERDRRVFGLPRGKNDIRSFLYPEIAVMYGAKLLTEEGLPLVIRMPHPIDSNPELLFEQFAEEIMQGNVPSYTLISGNSETYDYLDIIKINLAALLSYRHVCEDYPTLKNNIVDVVVADNGAVTAPIASIEQITLYREYYNVLAERYIGFSILTVKDLVSALRIRAYIDKVLDGESVMFTTHDSFHIVTTIRDLYPEDIVYNNRDDVVDLVMTEVENIDNTWTEELELDIRGFYDYATITGLFKDRSPELVRPEQGQISHVKYNTDKLPDGIDTYEFVLTLTYDDYFTSGEEETSLFRIAISSDRLLYVESLVTKAWNKGHLLSDWAKETVTRDGIMSRNPSTLPEELKIAHTSVDNGNKAIALLEELVN